jgi:hypothetical protein
MPAWATVAITLGGAALVALAGIVGAYLAFRGSQLSLRHAEREAWRTRLIEAADALSQSGTAMVTHVNLALRDAHQSGRVDSLVLDELRAGIADAIQKRMHLELLFGEGEANTAASAMNKKIVDAFEVLTNASPGDELPAALVAASRCINAADEAHDKFLHAAHLAVEPKQAHLA